MGRVYDVISRLQNQNERPVIKIDEEHSFTINTSKTNVLMMMGYIKKKEKETKDNPEAEISMTDHLIKMALGEKAAEYIESQCMAMAAISDIVQVIMAAIGDTEVDFEQEVEEEKK